jgi:hypothetical protein
MMVIGGQHYRIFVTDENDQMRALTAAQWDRLKASIETSVAPFVRPQPGAVPERLDWEAEHLYVGGQDVNTDAARAACRQVLACIQGCVEEMQKALEEGSAASGVTVQAEPPQPRAPRPILYKPSDQDIANAQWEDRGLHAKLAEQAQRYHSVGEMPLWLQYCMHRVSLVWLPPEFLAQFQAELTGSARQAVEKRVQEDENTKMEIQRWLNACAKEAKLPPVPQIAPRECGDLERWLEARVPAWEEKDMSDHSVVLLLMLDYFNYIQTTGAELGPGCPRLKEWYEQWEPPPKPSTAAAFKLCAEKHPEDVWSVLLAYQHYANERPWLAPTPPMRHSFLDGVGGVDGE